LEAPRFGTASFGWRVGNPISITRDFSEIKVNNQIPRRRSRNSVSETTMLRWQEQRIVVKPLHALRPSKNARLHSRRQIKLLKRSIERFGFINPILIDKNNRIIAGHGRVKAAEEAELDSVPTVEIDHLSDNEIRAYIIADNRLAEKANWDKGLLAIELHELSEIGFDIEAIGFEPAEVDLIFEDAAEAEEQNGPDDTVPETEVVAISKLGDQWICDKHRIACGDARKAAAYDSVLSGEKASFIFSDPPYNVAIDGHVSGLGKTQHREFAMASGEMKAHEFMAFLEAAFRQMAAYSLDGSVHQICMDWRHAWEIMTAGRKVYRELKNICVWCKTNAGMGSFYRSQHELIFVWVKGSGHHVNNIELGRYGRSRSNVWTYQGVNTFKRGRENELRMHPTVKPVALVADAIKDCSLHGAIVLDPFGGSGTTLIAAEKTGRKARVIEIDPYYVDVAIRRWQAYTGKFAVHSESGRTFDEVEDDRPKRKPRR
jgi:DNA modification methylase